MNFLNMITGGLELKKQYLVIATLTLIVAVLGGMYAMIQNSSPPTDTQERSAEIAVDVTVEQEKQDPDKTSKFREGEFKKSKPINW